jgi:hypothetical protein
MGSKDGWRVKGLRHGPCDSRRADIESDMRFEQSRLKPQTGELRRNEIRCVVAHEDHPRLSLRIEQFERLDGRCCHVLNHR